MLAYPSTGSKKDIVFYIFEDVSFLWPLFESHSHVVWIPDSLFLSLSWRAVAGLAGMGKLQSSLELWVKSLLTPTMDFANVL